MGCVFLTSGGAVEGYPLQQVEMAGHPTLSYAPQFNIRAIASVTVLTARKVNIRPTTTSRMVLLNI
jgi:hypothetical protein